MKSIFTPETVALIGATDREGSVGKTLLDNLAASEDIRLFPVNPGRETLSGLKCYPDVGSITEKVDLAIIATPAATVPEIAEACGKAGVKGVIVVSAGFREVGSEGKMLEERLIAVRERYGLRIVGPNCLGVILPNRGLNASFLKVAPEKGKIAFLSQSGALGSAILNWAVDSHVGFSMFASLGSMLDVDFGDLIDYLGEDPHTKSIMIYMESVGNAKKFMSAARGFARSKPIIILKPGRFTESARAASSHTGSMAGDDDVYEAAFRRAGVVRVSEISDLFNAAEALDSRYLPHGPKLAIITNAGGPGVMATDTVIDLGGELAALSGESMKRLDALLPSYWSRANPVDILGDADEDRYVEALKTCLEDEEVNGVLVIYTPQGTAGTVDLARTLSSIAGNAYIPVLTVWMGGREAGKGRELFLENDIPSFATPEEAVRTYMSMFSYGRNLKLLYETPAELPLDQAPPTHHLKALIKRSLKEGVKILSEKDSKSFLHVYDIPVAETHLAADAADAASLARNLGFPVLIKISSPDITHKSDVKGVSGALCSEGEVRAAYDAMLDRVKAGHPDARIDGVTVEKMIEEIDYEIILGAKRDKDFGSVILFGMGGVQAELFQDFAVGLPPLNQTLARRLMEGTKAFKLISGFRGRQAADMDRMEQVIVSFSRLIVDFPEIVEFDINPLAISKGAPFALDARIIIDERYREGESAYSHLVMAPYPTRYITPWKMSDGREVLLRPIRPEDEPLEKEMLSTLSEEALRYRFFQVIRKISHEMLTRFCNIDYDREIAIVAELKEEGERKIVGIGRLIIEPDFKKGEYAVVVHDNYQRRGLGNKLVDMLIGFGQEKGLNIIYGQVLTENKGMLKICERMGFKVKDQPDRISYVELTLK
ncbi:MAG: bifunctional acetate--CoA ligase family protein/GNAT family N-acetyltransferase [bacterium]|nr:bifunctional acetate--CoA ligase family protein/GNAT family N-acetyltransferase [bacterium]